MFDIYPKDTKVIDAAKIYESKIMCKKSCHHTFKIIFCVFFLVLGAAHRPDSCKVEEITKKKKRDRELGVLVYS